MIVTVKSLRDYLAAVPSEFDQKPVVVMVGAKNAASLKARGMPVRETEFIPLQGVPWHTDSAVVVRAPSPQGIDDDTRPSDTEPSDAA